MNITDAIFDPELGCTAFTVERITYTRTREGTTSRSTTAQAMGCIHPGTPEMIQLLPEVQGEGARGPWVRGGFVIETGDDYIRKVAFTAFGEERVAMVKSIPMGTMVQVNFNPESREFNEKWYTDLRAISITPMVSGAVPTAAAPMAAPAPAAGVQYPSTFQTPPAAAAPTMPDPEDDLPF